MRCRLCGREASKLQEREGYAIECRRCGSYWLASVLVREVLRPHADQLSLAVRALNDAGRPRVELYGLADIRRVLAEAEELEPVAH